MKFDGRIIKVLPVRSGVSQNGGEWKVLPFVFAYKENADDRWEDRVLLETMDRNHMVEIAKYCVTDEGKVMPPKSTWFEPKLQSGLFIHRI